MTRRPTDDERAEAEWFSAFDNPIRLRMLRALVGTTLTLKELAAAVGVYPTNTGTTVGILARAGLVTMARDGRFVRCALAAGVKVTKTALTFTSPEGNTVTLTR